jgi:diaminopimelate epimerase
MPLVRFSKYSVYGNILIFIDEVSERQLGESDKSDFARAAINEHLGIGADNLIMVQTYSPELIREIGEQNKYWKTSPLLSSEPDPDYVFRMFEPDGREALCCGNGLVCTAHHLYAHYGVEAARILTEIPSSIPKVRKIEAVDFGKGFRVNMGCPCLIPETLVNADLVTHTEGSLAFFRDYPIHIEWINTSGEDRRLSAAISGCLTYTGEPHLIVFENPDSRSEDDVSSIFRQLFGEHSSQREDSTSQNQMLDSDKIFHKIGLNFNAPRSVHFPQGINLNFARVVNENGVIECRSFERGINKETLACGTGALAVAFAAHQLHMVKSNRIEVWPKRGRRLDLFKDAWLRASRGPSGDWWLETEPRCIFSGTFEFPQS